MEQITLRIPSDTLEEVESEADEEGKTRSEYLRDVIDSRHEHEELRTEVERLRTEVERKERRVEAVLEQREEHTDLVRAVEREQSLQERKAKAGVVTRLKWWATGMPDDSD
jgi:chromosome segregation ATPase